MCGRFYIAEDDAILSLIKRLARLYGVELKTGDIVPGDMAPGFISDGGIKAKPMRWGFENGFSRMIINARSESAPIKPTFAKLFNESRALLLASAYYEWDSNGKRHTFGTGAGMYLAGLYRPSDNAFVVLTRDAAEGIKSVHPRMPVIFDRQAGESWLNPALDPKQTLKYGLTDKVLTLSERSA